MNTSQVKQVHSGQRWPVVEWLSFIFVVSGLAILPMLFMLTGCIPVAFVAGASAGLVIYDQRTPKTITSDKNRGLVIQQHLNADRELWRQSHVTVAVFNGVALLIGQTPTEELRARAEEIARQTDGIKLIYNEISIEEPIHNSARHYDVWLTTKVRSALTVTHGLNSSTLKVVTENGVVYLMGMTTKYQGQIAASKAQEVSGVKKVVKLFEYIT